MRWAPKAVTVPVAHGSLEGLLQVPEQWAFGAIVCHPHSQLGGTLNSHVVYRLAHGLHDAGAAVLRFNFRGVGRSTGTFAGGIGEMEDVRAALDFVAARFPSVPLLMAGFSFGAFVGLSVGAGDARVAGLLGAGLALSSFDHSFLAGVKKPKAFVQGERDDFGSAPAMQAFFGGLAEPKRLETVPGAGHLFHGKLSELEAAIGRAVDFLKAFQAESLLVS